MILLLEDLIKAEEINIRPILPILPTKRTLESAYLLILSTLALEGQCYDSKVNQVQRS